MYRTRISLKSCSLTIDKVRYQPHKTWVTHDAPIELPRKIELACQEIIEKADTCLHAIALLDLIRFHARISTSQKRSLKYEQDVLRA